MQHSRTFPYDENSVNVSTGRIPSQNISNIPVSSQTYHRDSYQAQQGLQAGQYYASSQTRTNSASQPQNQYVREMWSNSQAYPSQFPDGRGHWMPEVASSSSHNQSNRPFYIPSQASYSSQQHHVHQQNHPSQSPFIPTPSEMSHAYPNYPTPNQIAPRRPSHSPDTFRNPEYQQPRVPSSSQASLSHRHTSTTDPQNAARPGASPTSTSFPGERFPCEKCEKTFSRAHDRKRHHDSQHLPTPAIHRCQYCEKEFSRADSLKRHLDNGCDEMPRSSTSMARS